MKGIHGLIVAVALGLAGAAANFFYLNTEAQKKDMVAFIGIKKGVIVARGERLTDDNLVKVEIPANHVGNLRDYVFLWDERVGVKDMPVWRTLDSKTDSSTEAALLLRSDVKTPLKELELGKDEVIRWIPVDSRSFVPSLIAPGDQVSFILPRFQAGPTRAGRPKPAAEPGKPAADAAGIPALEPKGDDNTDIMEMPASQIEIIGPFTVLSVGNRLGDAKIMQSGKIPQLQENVLGIRVSSRVPGEAEKAAILWDRLQAVNFRQVGIQRHGK
ncbi:MAG: hypothetical protein ACLP9L_23440 [Thermoguttaceae bacterium]